MVFSKPSRGILCMLKLENHYLSEQSQCLLTVAIAKRAKTIRRDIGGSVFLRGRL